jgi:hypothetical protein
LGVQRKVHDLAEKKISVAKFKEVKTRTNLAEAMAQKCGGGSSSVAIV